MSYRNKPEPRDAYSVNNLVRVQVREPLDNLAGERLDNVFFKLAMPPETAADRTTRHVFKETIYETLLDDKVTLSKMDITYTLKNSLVFSKPRY